MRLDGMKSINSGGTTVGGSTASPERGRSIVVLTVHGVGRPPRPLDPGEDATWVGVDCLEHVLDVVAHRADVRLTFDDGNASDVEIALPRLLERGLTAEFFVLAGRLGEPGRLDEAGVRALADAGMRIGSHGWAHRDWRRIDDAQAVDEIEHAPRLLSEIVGRPVDRVAVPFGSYDRRVLSRLRRANVRGVYTSDGGRTSPARWLQTRTSLRHDMGADHVRRLVNHRPSPRIRARRALVMFVKRTR
jgi:peptidoglycan/xylan/chitin deacetylase (PgdA/CDA1 family)